MYEFVTIYCVSGICAGEILVLCRIDTCSIISKYLIKNTNYKKKKRKKKTHNEHKTNKIKLRTHLVKKGA
jgi:hypothetical protein